MTIGWKRHYHLPGTYCETSGWIPISQDAFRFYLARVVRPEWQRWITIEPTLAQSLIQTGFSSDTIEEFMRVDTTDLSKTSLWGDFGEVFSVLFLTEQNGMKFPWPTFWDRRIAQASLGGSDIVGFAYDSGGALLVLGQAKTSAEERQPPTVVTHPKHGLIAQLELLCNNRTLVISHIRWLLLRSQGTEWVQDLWQAMSRYFEESTKIFVGVLVRDCSPSISDLRTAHSQFNTLGNTKVRLFGCYVPIGLDECIEIATNFPGQGDANAN